MSTHVRRIGTPYSFAPLKLTFRYRRNAVVAVVVGVVVVMGSLTAF